MVDHGDEFVEGTGFVFLLVPFFFFKPFSSTLERGVLVLLFR